VKLKIVQPEASAARIQIHGWENLQAIADAARSSANCRAAIAMWRAGCLR
jgi:hypothetical protein